MLVKTGCVTVEMYGYANIDLNNSNLLFVNYACLTKTKTINEKEFSYNNNTV